MPDPTTDRATLERRLAELEDARHALLMGRRVASVGADGRSVAYQPADLPALNAEIGQIKRALGRAGAYRVRF